MRSRRCAFLVVAALLAGCQDVRAEPLDDALDAARAAVHAPAVTATIHQCGTLRWSGASGSTRKGGAGTTVAPTTPFVLASSTKIVTATMIMQLVDRGRLTLSTPLSRFYPRLPNARRITIAHLLRHTSGLPEYDTVDRVNDALGDPRHRWSRRELTDGLRRARFAPGRRFDYTNSNYIVLGGIIERLTGETIQRTFTRQVAGPAGMRSASFVRGALRGVPHPYETAPGGRLNDLYVSGFGIATDTWGEVWTDGGLATTATDAARFLDALFAGALVAPATLQRMTRLGKGSYGLGVYGQQTAGHAWLGHDGSYGGFESELWHDPARRLTVAVLTNRDESDTAPDTTSGRILLRLVRAVDAEGARCP